MQIETLNPIKIKVSGSERFDFLQNIITNDLNKLEEELFSYILTPQGKILYEIIITNSKESYDLVCTNDQNYLATYLKKYASLSDVDLHIENIDAREYNEKYILNQLSSGNIDANLLKHSSLLPSEINDELVDYSKGCFVGQEVVSRIKHRQLNKKKVTVKVFEQKPQNLPNNSEILFQLNNYFILREPVVLKK
jgi:folate-binding protein YgfZ